MVCRVEERHPGHRERWCPRRDADRDVDHGAGRVDDATDDADDARFALGHWIEFRVELDGTRPDAGHAGDDAAEFTDDFTADDATHFTAAHHDHRAAAAATPPPPTTTTTAPLSGGAGF